MNNLKTNSNRNSDFLEQRFINPMVPVKTDYNEIINLSSDMSMISNSELFKKDFQHGLNLEMLQADLLFQNRDHEEFEIVDIIEKGIILRRNKIDCQTAVNLNTKTSLDPEEVANLINNDSHRRKSLRRSTQSNSAFLSNNNSTFPFPSLIKNQMNNSLIMSNLNKSNFANHRPNSYIEETGLYLNNSHHSIVNLSLNFKASNQNYQRFNHASKNFEMESINNIFKPHPIKKNHFSNIPFLNNNKIISKNSYDSKSDHTFSESIYSSYDVSAYNKIIKVPDDDPNDDFIAKLKEIFFNDKPIEVEVEYTNSKNLKSSFNLYQRDLERLYEPNYLNDNLIFFYLK